MVGHETIGVADPIIALIDVLQGVEEVQAVSIIFENRFFLVPAGGYVIYGAGIFNAEGTRHGQRLAEKTATVKLQDLTL